MSSNKKPASDGQELFEQHFWNICIGSASKSIENNFLARGFRMKSLLLKAGVTMMTFAFGLAAVSAFGFLFTPVVKPNDSSDAIIDVEFSAVCQWRSPNAEMLGVYSAILNDSFYKNDPILVIGEMTERGGTYMDEQIDKGDVPGAAADTIASFKPNNLEPTSLKELLSALPKVVFWTEQDNKATFREGFDGMTRFFKKYPKSRGILSLSNIGCNQKHNQALVYFSYYCGSLCAGGMFIVLEKKNGRWIVSRKNELWVS